MTKEHELILEKLCSSTIESPHQIMMERVISKLPPLIVKVFQDTDGRFLPLKEWQGLTLNAHGEVLNIKWSKVLYHWKLYGTHSNVVEFAHLPQTVKEFRIADGNLQCEIDLEKLPASLQVLDLFFNPCLKGKLSLFNLPKNLRALKLVHTSLTGPVDLTHLPENLEVLDIECTKKVEVERLDLQKIPSSVKTLRINGQSLLL